MKLKIQDLISSIGLTDSQAATEIEKMSGLVFPRRLINNAIEGVPIPARRASLLCQWLSSEFGKEIKPEHTNLKIHPASALPDAADTKESAACWQSKINGFVEGFNLAYAARCNNQALSNEEALQQASQATTKRMSIFQESAGSALSQDAFYHGCAFAANGMTAVFSRPNGSQKFQELKAMDKGQREQYARTMAMRYLEYL